ncbi:hypothetical protein L6164_014125 [Bauhinia variegata]|uniref:Uncharacterized protein n=1 Tax=Bauhinia variegata TaxID=167791 RepID=A0ACB9NGF7_BAUVA|nr:hypothetical protein L6164_014125 [Bauhinia variegata]
MDLFLRMRNPISLKQEFLRKWIMGLRKCASSKKNMNVVERKKVIKLSADLAMASTRNETTRWSQALIFSASQDDDNKVLAEQILGSTQCQSLTKAETCSSTLLCNSNRRIRSRKILKRSHRIHRVKKSVAEADSIAKRLVQKRTRMLKSLVPGGEFMDDVSLIEETLDYMQSLRAQVEVMRCLLTASELTNRKYK